MDTAFKVVEAYYKRICEYMQVNDCGSVIGKGCGTPGMTQNSLYPRKAYLLGKNLK